MYSNSINDKLENCLEAEIERFLSSIDYTGDYQAQVINNHNTLVVYLEVDAEDDESSDFYELDVIETLARYLRDQTTIDYSQFPDANLPEEFLESDYEAEFEEYIYLIAYIKNLHSSSYLQGLIQHCNQRQSLKCSVVLKPESANINTKIDFREQLQKEAKLIQSQENKNSSAKTEQSDSSTSEPPAKRQKKTDNSNETNDAGISNPISEDGDGIQSNTTIEDKSLLPTFRSP